MNSLLDVQELSDSDLLDAAREAVRQENQSVARLLAFLGDIEARKLHLERGFSSLYAYCESDLGLFEGRAYRRIAAARLARRFPVVIGRVAEGTITLTALNLLRPHIDQANHRELLRAVEGRTKRQVKELLAARMPQPDPTPSVRKLPPATVRRAGPPAPPAKTDESTPARDRAGLVLEPPPLPRPMIEPIAAQRYSLRFAAPKSLVDKLEELEALRSHRPVEARAMARIVEDAVDLLLAQERKKRFAVGARPRRSQTAAQSSTAGAPRTRHIPASVRREVYERDGGRCTFEDPLTGRRCGTQQLLTYEHLEPFARGGSHSIESITLRCAGHNRLAADRAFGRDFMDQRVEQSRRDRRRTVASDSTKVGGTGSGQLDLLAAVPESDERAA